MGEPPEDGEDGIKEGQGGGHGGLVHVTPGNGHGKVGTDLAGRAGGDTVVVQTILTRSPCALGDVARHRGPSAFELRGQISVVVADALDRRAKGANHLKGNFVDLEAFHGDLPCGGRKQAVVLQ